MIYFIQDTVQMYVKIGKTKDKLFQRMVSLQIGNPNTLICLRVIESEIDDTTYHKMFRKFWHRGEWFKPESELMKFIEGLPKTEHTGMTTTMSRFQRNRLGTGFGVKWIKHESGSELQAKNCNDSGNDLQQTSATNWSPRSDA